MKQEMKRDYDAQAHELDKIN
jgi:hypothetical protein